MLACGAFNGFLVTAFGLPSIVVTIGTMSLHRRIAQVVLGDQAITGYPSHYTDLAQSFMIDWPRWRWRASSNRLQRDGSRNLMVELTIGLGGEVDDEPSLADLIAASEPTDPGCPRGIVDPVRVQWSQHPTDGMPQQLSV